MLIIALRLGFFKIWLSVVLLLMPVLVHAQYFGRNKVVYKNLEFEVLHTEHFDVHFYIEDSSVVNDFAMMAERWHDRFSAALKHTLVERKPLIFYENHADFQQTNAIGGFIDPGVQGVTEGFKNRLIMPLATSYAGTDHVLGHEMVHVFQYDIAMAMPGVGLKGMSALPLWIIEGMAEYMSVGRVDPLTSQYLRDALVRDKLPTYKDMYRKTYDYNPYHYGQAFWAYLAGTYGDDIISRFYKVALGAGLDSAFSIVVKRTPETVFSEWHQSIREQYADELDARVVIKDDARLLLSEEKRSGSMNITPVISPNGRYVAYITEKDLFTIELYLANAFNGRIIKKLTRSSLSSHFDAIRFLTTAGGWSPNSRKFAFVGLSKGRDVIIVLDLDTRKVDRQYAIPDAPAISDPNWSPDGKTIVFSGNKEGKTDLYLLDVASGNVTRLTQDKFADFQPIYSPDGQRIAFVTDRKGTDFQTLSFAPYSLAFYDLRSGEIEVLDIFNGALHYNPQFTPDSTSVVFLSDVEGFSEIYRYSLEDGSTYKLTNYKRGVTGITEISPAISLASQTGRLVFSALVDNKFNIYSLNAEDLAGEPFERTAEMTKVGFLPPAEPQEVSVVAQYLSSPRAGLSVDTARTVTDYKPKFSLDYIGQAGLGVGVSNFGSAVVGGINGIFSDILGNNLIGVGVQMNGRDLNDLGGQFQYYNLKGRVQFGGSIYHVPLRYVMDAYYTTTPDGIPAVTYEFLRMNIDKIAPGFIYPFSIRNRLEFEGGITRYGFNVQHLTEDYYGRVESKYFDELAPPDVLAFEPAIAYVHDNSYFGFTSPAKGSRLRLEAQPTIGTFRFVTLLTDLRKYVFLRPFTVAGRILQYGRYGPGSLGIFSTLYLGNPSLIRGYSYGSFRQQEVVDTSESTDPIVLERLFGSRISVANFEVRVPLLGVRQYGLINLPYVPLELLGFFDAGLAWDSQTKPYIKGITFTDPDNLPAGVQPGRVPVYSTGIGARVNVFGYIVLQVYYAYPFQRPIRGGHFGFAIEPGW